MDYLITITGLLFTLILSNCNNQQDLSITQSAVASEVMNEYQDTETTFKNVILTSRTSFPGVQSNLRGTRKYELSIDVDLNSALEFKRLMVDSVAIPLAALIINGEKASGFLMEESKDVVKITAYRSMYSTDPNAQQVYDPVIYNDSGLRLSKGAVLEYLKGGKPYYLEIAEIQLMPYIYAP